MRHLSPCCLSFTSPVAGLQPLPCFLLRIVTAQYPIQGAVLSEQYMGVKGLALDVMAAPAMAHTVEIKSTPCSYYWTFSCQVQYKGDLISSTKLSITNQRIYEQNLHAKAVCD